MSGSGTCAASARSVPRRQEVQGASQEYIDGLRNIAERYDRQV